MKDVDRTFVKEVSAPAVPASIEVPGLYVVQPEAQVQSLVEQVGYTAFLEELYDEIVANYQDPAISSLDRGELFGEDDSYPLSTYELMGCRATDFSVFKKIGSDPRRQAQGLSTVYGDMSCLETQTGVLRLQCSAAFLTALRTATTSALAVHTLKPEATTLSVIGAGEQGITHAFVIAALSPRLRKIYLNDIDSQRAAEAVGVLQSKMQEGIGDARTSSLSIEAVDADDARLKAEADVIVTATYGTEEVLAEPLNEDAVIAAVGADMPDAKREISRALYERAKFVADDLRQSLYEGELQYAAEQLGITKEQRAATEHRGKLLDGRVIGLADLLAEPEVFRQRPERLTMYDSSGWAGQDLAAARVILRRLVEAGVPAFPWGRPPAKRSLSSLMTSR